MIESPKIQFHEKLLLLDEHQVLLTILQGWLWVPLSIHINVTKKFFKKVMD